MSFKDKTFCASPNCQNECGRKMTEYDHDALTKIPVEQRVISQAYFCDVPRELWESLKFNESPE